MNNAGFKITLAKWYTRLIGIAFLFVTISLINDYIKFGLQIETGHKALHIVIGAAIITWAWKNERLWKPLCFGNGIVFGGLALIGWIFPDLGGLATFNFTDTTLHTAVGFFGLGIGLYTTT